MKMAPHNASTHLLESAKHIEKVHIELVFSSKHLKFFRKVFVKFSQYRMESSHYV